MSKSLGNVVDPRDVIKEYGADSLRIWEAFMGDYFADVNWSDEGVKSANKFMTRVCGMKDFLCDGQKISKELSYIFNYTIKKVTEDIDKVKFNTAISQLMILVNAIYKEKKVNRYEYKTLLTLLNPFAPHITEELWMQCGFGNNFLNATWPSYDESKLVQDKVEIAVQVNSKIVARVDINPNDSQEDIINGVKVDRHIAPMLEGKNVLKEIYVPGRIINFIVK